MTQIDSATQAIIARIGSVDLTQPRLDKEAVAAALAKHLKGLALPHRPTRWFHSAAAAYRYVFNLARTAAWTAADTAQAAAVSAAVKNCLNSADYAAWTSAWDAAWRAAKGASDSDLWNAAWETHQRASWVEARSAAEHAAWIAARSAVENAVRGAACLNGSVRVSHPVVAKLANMWLPMVDAFEAGLWLYWITSCELICVPHPTLSIVHAPLHGNQSLAVEWPDGEAWFSQKVAPGAGAITTNSPVTASPSALPNSAGFSGVPSARS